MTKQKEKLNSQAEEIYQGWLREAEAIERKFGNFSLSKEIQNPKFKDLLRKGVSVEDAFKVVHIEELIDRSWDEDALLNNFNYVMELSDAEAGKLLKTFLSLNKVKEAISFYKKL